MKMFASLARAASRAHVAIPRRPVAVRPASERSALRRTEIGGVLYGPTLQPKLTVGPPDDAYEREADRVAEQVMRMPEPDGNLQRMCSECEEELQRRPLDETDEDEDLVRAKSSPGEALEISDDVAGRIQALRGRGRALPESARAFFEPRFGADFGQVRIHDDSRASEVAQAVNARAFTIGPDIVFGSGEHQPDTAVGGRLLAHELTHVVQQGAGHRLMRQAGESRQPRSTQLSAPVSRRLASTVCVREPFLQRFPANTPAGDPNVPGVNHGHAASGSWWRIRLIEAGNCVTTLDKIACSCASFDPMEVVGAAVLTEFSGKPLARRHLSHYLGGGGADFAEDVPAFIAGDVGVRAKLASQMSTAPRGDFKVEQHDYANQDFRFAFGAIDRLDYRVDSSAGVVHVWFVDRYEWHPVYPGIYTPQPGDGRRVTNCVHAALVELKGSGAADFWMVGYGALPITSVTTGASGTGSSGGSGESTL